MDQVTVLAPATVANVVCGFDCLGFALEEPFDEITLRKIDKRDVRISHHDDFGLPTHPTKNVAGIALIAMLDSLNADFGFEVEITKRIKPGSGIGSSAASSCGAVFAANSLLGGRFSSNELIDFAMEGELAASGTKHADNLAPSIFGGFTLVRSAEPLDIISLEFPPLFATIIHPQIEIKTAEARAILPKDVPLRAAVRNWSNLGAFVAALAKGDYYLLSRSMEDLIIEPARKSLIPKFDELKAESLAAGALGGGISGSGPSVFMLSETIEIAQSTSSAMHSIYSTTGVDFNIYISSISPTGVRLAQ